MSELLVWLKKHNNQNTSDYIMNVSRDCKNPMLLLGHSHHKETLSKLHFWLPV